MYVSRPAYQHVDDSALMRSKTSDHVAIYAAQTGNTGVCDCTSIMDSSSAFLRDLLCMQSEKCMSFVGWEALEPLPTQPLYTRAQSFKREHRAEAAG